MFWLRLFWVEAALLPAAGLWWLWGYPAETRYRTTNLVVLSMAVIVGVTGAAYSEWRRARGGTSHGSSAH